MSKNNKESDYPRAFVHEVDGQLVLEDPDAIAIIRAIGKENCKNTFELNLERVDHFQRRLVEREMSPDQAVIVLLNVDDVHGGPLADILMPSMDWQPIRDRGEVPFARGLAMRKGIQGILGAFDNEASEKLRQMNDVAVVVVDHGVAEIFPASH